MGQVVLGIRSLLIKATIFFVMCALLVWALGGQLFPAPEIIDRPAVEFAGQTWFWRLYAGGDEPNSMHWELMVHRDGKPQTYEDVRWADVAELMVLKDELYYAGQRTQPSNVSRPWVIGRVDSTGKQQVWQLPSRLALEEYLASVRSGNILQDVDENSAMGSAGLDPSSGTADESNSPPSS